MNKKLSILILLMFALGIGIGFWIAGQVPEKGHGADSSTSKKPLFYRSPMNPSITSPVPAKDAMGMDYGAVQK